MSKKQLCYQCFQEFAPHEVWFRCENAAAEGNRTETCAFQIDRYQGNSMRRAFPFHGSLLATARSFFKAPTHCYCDKCGHKSHKRICPHCHWKLPSSLGQLAEQIVAIVGNSSSGKSHYFTVLLESELRNGITGQRLGACLGAADNDTEKLYNKAYWEPLFGQKLAIQQTQADIAQIGKRHLRLIWSLTLTLQKIKRKLTLVFYDIAGELLQDVGGDDDAKAKATRYLWNSSGIIYLVNPRDVLGWRRYLTLSDDDLATPIVPPDVLLNKIVNALRENASIAAEKKIKIPIAVCVSQFDRLYEKRAAAGLREELFDPATAPFEHSGSLNQGSVESESQEIQDFLGRSGANALVQMAVQNFATCRFFAVSALGSTPVGLEQRIEEIKPCRVAIPFVWILSKTLGKKR